MFQLRFLPLFAHQKKSLLAERDIPFIPIPPSVEACLSGFAEPARVSGLTPGRLWLESFRAVKPMLMKAAAISLLSSACAACSTLAAMRFLKEGSDLRLMWLLSLTYFVMNATAQICIFQSGRLRNWIGLGVEAELVRRISTKLLRLSAAAAGRQSSGNLKTLITSDVRNIGQFLDNATRNILPALTGLAVCGPLLVYFAGRPGIFGLAVMGSALPIAVVLNRISAHFQARSQARLDDLTSLAGEWMKNIRLVRYLSWDEAFRRDVSGAVHRFLSVSVIQHFMACLIFGISMTWWMVATTGSVLISQLLGSPLDLPGFFGSLWLLTFLNGYFTHIPNTIRLYGLASPSIARIVRLLREEEQSERLTDGAAVPDGRPAAIVFEDVGYSYPGGKEAIRDLSLRLPLTEQVALIGEIGSGKTTLLKLLCGEFPPTRGRVLVEFEGGEQRELWSRSTYPVFRSSLAYVPQEPFVSNDLFYRNISLSDRDPDDDVMAAAYWAELQTDLDALPLGLAQEIGEGGVNLSGGQRQRLNLARAVFSRRDYMVLDDTLSAVDVRTESSLMERLVARGKGFVLVTHRTRELFRVGQILVMWNGSVVERGDPAVLAADPDSAFNRALRAYDDEGFHG